MSHFHAIYRFRFEGGGSIDLSPFFGTPGIVSPRWIPPGTEWALVGDEGNGWTTFGRGPVLEDGTLEPGEGFGSSSGGYGYQDLIFSREAAYAADYCLGLAVVPPLVAPCRDDPCCPPGGRRGGSPVGGFGGGCGGACHPAPSLPAVPGRSLEASGHPVRYGNGEVQLTVADLEVGGFGLAWGHQRTYTNQATLNHDFGNGYNWSVPQWAHAIEIGGDGSTVVVVLGAGESYWFERVEAVYVPRHGARVQLEHDVSGPSGLYRFQHGDGTLWEFYDYQPDYGCPAGSLKSVVTPGGQRLQLVYQGTFGPLTEALRSGMDAEGEFVEERLEYTYYGSGEHAGRLESLTLRRHREYGPIEVPRRVVYSYCDGAETGGSLGDLKAVTTQYPDGSGGWTDGPTHYYRYWTDGEPGGFPHGLKYALGPDSFARLSADPEVSDPWTTDDEKVAQYADHYFEYGTGDRVAAEAVAGASQTIEFAYTAGTHADGYNDWKRRTVESRADGSQTVAYTNFLGQVLVRELRVPGGSESWIESRRYDAAGRLVEIAAPAAVESYVDDGGPEENELAVTLRADRGLIRTYAYHDGQSGPAGQLRAEGLRRGASGDGIVLREYEYGQHSGGGRTVYPLVGQVVYREEDGGGPIETAVGYTWHPGGVQVQQQVTTLPAVSAAQNGPGASATVTHRFDEQGSLVWERDERGFITHHQYDPVSGGRRRTVQDVDAARLAVPAGWNTPSAGGLHLVTDFAYDDVGRLTQTLGPPHAIDGRTVRRAAWTVYQDAQREVWTADGYQCEAESAGYGGDGEEAEFVLVNPVTIRKHDAAGRWLEEIQAVRGSTAGALSPTDSFAQSDYVRWTTHRYGPHGRLVASRVYHAIPASGTGTAEAHYDETAYGYDALGRQNLVRSPGETVTRTVLDFQGRARAVYVGTDDRGATDADPTGGGDPDNNMVLVSEYEYAGPGGCEGCWGGGAGLVTAEIRHVDGAATRATQYLYDWRNRRQYVIHDADARDRVTFARHHYDNLDRPIRVERYHDVAGDGIDPDEDPQPDDLLLARSDTLYDDRGRVYRTIRYAVDPATGDVGSALVGNTWYDAAGNVIKQLPGGTQRFTKTAHDSLGRATTTYVGFDTAESSYADATNVTGDTIFEQTEMAYDAGGSVIQTTHRARLHDATGTGGLSAPTGSQPQARVTYTAFYRDPIGREIAQARYGDNGGASFTRSDTIPARSDTVLVNSIAYNDAGQPAATTDPAGKEDRTFYDDAGRVVRTVENYTDDDPNTGAADEDRTVEFTYSPDGQRATITARQQSSANDQTTTYVYGTTLSDSDIARSDLLRAVIYPDSDDSGTGVPPVLSDGPDNVYDRVEHRYNRQGEIKETKDQTETVHAFEFDKLGRQTQDRVTTLGAGVDGAVRRVSTTYDVRGLVEKITVYDNAAVGSGSALDEVVREYNDVGLLTKEYQEHGGAKAGSTPYVGYNYDESATSGEFTKGLRLTSIRYPNGRLVHHTYGTSGSDDDNLNRLAAIHDDSSGSPGATLAAYTYLGLDRVVSQELPEPDIHLDLFGGTSGIYAGLDRFDRVIDQLWYDYGSSADVDRFKYGYDRASNRTWRENTVSKNHSTPVCLDEFYTYDGLHRLKSMNRGELNATKSGITGTPSREEDWSLDPLGNWSGYTQTTSGTTDLDQSRSVNRVNEITGISETTGPTWVTPAYDRAGNMTTMPKPADPAESFTATYDAWNRMVKVEAGTSTVAEYSYDGLHRRTTKTVDSTVRYFYYTSSWQGIEERLGSSTSPDRQFIWSPLYIDQLVLRDRDTDVNGMLDERLYALQDANWNVACVVDTNGDAVERYLYDPHGTPTMLVGSFSVRPSTAFDWESFLTGQRADQETGLYLFRRRILHSQLGLFSTRDPLGNIDGDHLYFPYFLPNETDPYGLIRLPDISAVVGGTLFGVFAFPVNPGIWGVFVRVTFTAKAGNCCCPNRTLGTYTSRSFEFEGGVFAGIMRSDVHFATPLVENLRACPSSGTSGDAGLTIRVVLGPWIGNCQISFRTLTWACTGSVRWTRFRIPAANVQVSIYGGLRSAETLCPHMLPNMV